MKTKLINLHVLFCCFFCLFFFPCSCLRKTNGPVLCATPTIKPLRTPGGGKVVGCYYKMDFIEPRLDIHKLSSRDEQITKASTEHHEQISVFVPIPDFFFFFLISSLYPPLFCPTTPPDWLCQKANKMTALPSNCLLPHRHLGQNMLLQHVLVNSALEEGNVHFLFFFFFFFLTSSQ